MLSITPSESPAGALKYFSEEMSRGDYLSERGGINGKLHGLVAERLDMPQVCDRATFASLAHNLDPVTGAQITERMRDDRIPGYDLTFGTPKTFTLLYETLLAEGRTEQAAALLAAFEDSVCTAMSEVEKNIQAQVNEPGGKHYSRNTDGGIVWAGFTHFQARPVDGVADPFIHQHAYLFNVTHDTHDGKWKAIDMYQTMIDRVYYQAVFFQSLAGKMQELGYQVERQGVSFEVAGISRNTIDKFSRRTEEVKERAHELGVTSAKSKRNLGAVTRAAKDEGLSPEETRKVFLERQTPEERAVFEHLVAENRAPVEPKGPTAREALDFAIAHAFERKSVVGTRRFYATAIMHALESGLTLEDVENAAKAHPSLLFGEDKFGNEVVTTREIRTEERYLRDYVEAQSVPSYAEVRAARGFAPYVLTREWLSDEQKRAVDHVMGSIDRVIGIRGGAGTGKTTAMEETVEAIEEATGKKVVVVAPTTNASHGTLRESGFAEADTLARFLVDKDLQKQARGGIVYVDEAGMVGAPTMRRLFELSANLGARIILQGDSSQHGAVERGDALRYLEEHGGLRFAELKEIRRQENPEYKRAVESFAKGDVADGYGMLDALGWVREIPADTAKEDSLHHALVRDYLDTLDNAPKNAERQKVAIIVAPTHEEIGTVSALVREGLRERGKLGEEKALTRLVAVPWTEAERQEKHRYREPERDGKLVVEFTQNATGFKKGERFDVVGLVDDKVILAAGKGTEQRVDVLPLEEAARFQVYTTHTLPLAVGDIVYPTQGGKDVTGQRLNRNTRYVVQGFDDDGQLLLGTKTRQNVFAGPPAGVVARKLATSTALHLAHGYAVTSHASQSATVDYVFASQSAKTFVATTREQAYVTQSRGRKASYVYTDDKQGLFLAAERSSARMHASDVVPAPVKAKGTKAAKATKRPPVAIPVPALVRKATPKPAPSKAATTAASAKGEERQSALAAAWAKAKEYASFLMRKAWGQREEDYAAAHAYATQAARGPAVAKATKPQKPATWVERVLQGRETPALER